ncbi:MAG: hypothetical protein HKN47_03440 [Pirellulaceae bacterium]|nr:hypothetical protein [Pirellulaceae bacterium]
METTATPLPNDLLKQIVRHQFYSKVDWPRCAAMDGDDVLQRELGAVIEYLIAEHAEVLPPSDRTELADSLISDTLRFGCEAMTCYQSAVADKRSWMTKIASWLLASAQNPAKAPTQVENVKGDSHPTAETQRA